MKKVSVLLALLILPILLAGCTNNSVLNSQSSKDQVKATVYVKEPTTGNFNVWNGLAFGQINPASIPKGFSAILPTGEYYVTIEAPDYEKITSLIVQVASQSIVTADVTLKQPNTFWEKVVRLFSVADKTNNFSLKVTPLPQENLLKIGEAVPEITALDTDGKTVNLFKTLDANKPTIIFVYSTWNTEAQEQMNIYKQLKDQLAERFNLLALTTLEPDNLNQTMVTRGEYNIDLYRPLDKFYQDYYIISLPQFFVLNENRELLGIINGSRPASELMDIVSQLLKK